MKTLEIKRSEAVAFFDSFSRKHEGWLTTVEVFGKILVIKSASRSWRSKASRLIFRNTSTRSRSVLGARADDHVTHTIKTPLCD